MVLGLKHEQHSKHKVYLQGSSTLASCSVAHFVVIYFMCKCYVIKDSSGTGWPEAEEHRQNIGRQNGYRKSDQNVTRTLPFTLH
jgi:hypothetical protein